jgi:hypothetical protein
MPWIHSGLPPPDESYCMWDKPTIFNQYVKISPLMESQRGHYFATIRYHILASAIIWSDELPPALDWYSENCLRSVLHYRTLMLMNSAAEEWRENWLAAKSAFPRWIGFTTKRCTPSSSLQRIIAESEKKSNKGIDRMEKLCDRLDRQKEQREQPS